MPNPLIAEHGLIQSLSADLPHLLQLLVGTLAADPLAAIREYVSNAYDASVLTPEAHIRVYEEAGNLIFEDFGYGMTLTTLQRKFACIGANVSKYTDSANIGAFGAGRLSAFMIARRLEVYTCHASESHGWQLTWQQDEAEFRISPCYEHHRGTKAVLHLKPEYAHLAYTPALREYLIRTFALLPMPVYLADDHRPVNPCGICPTLHDLPAGLPVKRLLALPQAQKLFSTYYPQQRLLAAYQAVTPDGTRIFMGLSACAEPQTPIRTQLFKKGVWVCEDDLLPPKLRFLSVLVDNPDLPLLLSRNAIRPQDAAYLEMQRVVEQHILCFFTLLAREQLRLLQKLLKLYGEALLLQAAGNIHWQHFLARYYAFSTNQGIYGWRELEELCEIAELYLQEPPSIRSRPGTPHPYHITVYVDDTEEKLLRLLASESQIRLRSSSDDAADCRSNNASLLSVLG